MQENCAVDLVRLAGVSGKSSLGKQRAANSCADHESAGATQETEVLVLDRPPRSCWELIRFAPSETSTFCVPAKERGKVRMSRHEARSKQLEALYGAAQCRALERLAKRRFDKDADLHGLVVVWLTMALLCEDHLERQFDRYMDYCRAEGIEDPYEYLKGTLAAKESGVCHA